MDDKLNAAEDPKLQLSMDAMNATTPGHYSEWNSRHQQLLDNDAYLQKQMEKMEQDVQNKYTQLSGAIGAKVMITANDSTPPSDTSVLWVHG